MISSDFIQQIDMTQIKNIESELQQLNHKQYREDWKCGKGGDYFWRMHGKGHMNDTTFAELEQQAKAAGWSFLVRHNGEDRYEYHCIEFHSKA